MFKSDGNVIHFSAPKGTRLYSALEPYPMSIILIATYPCIHPPYNAS